ncbi:hypothetical protein [Sporisorium scitamineum]|uniref:Uncharacterized protein n=1 Tax=Sporisorium scitamineum TaxID=49012 RepID=A0A0F7S3J6_9BASI|nr:hypothetical protein [Sporisorium scitamineum]
MSPDRLFNVLYEKARNAVASSLITILCTSKPAGWTACARTSVFV